MDVVEFEEAFVLVTQELGPIIRDDDFWRSPSSKDLTLKEGHYPVGGSYRKWLGLYPFREKIYGHHYVDVIEFALLVWPQYVY